MRAYNRALWSDRLAHFVRASIASHPRDLQRQSRAVLSPRRWREAARELELLAEAIEEGGRL